MKSVCFITNKYPNRLDENVLVFVQQLVWEMADLGVKCSVICPVPINLDPRYLRFPDKVFEITENGFEVEVYFPKYIGFGQSDIFKFNPAKITTSFFTNAVSKVISKMENKPDALYGHFVTPAGIAAARLGEKFNIPSYMAYGEATLSTIEHFGYREVSEELSSLNGVISVSTQNKNMLTSVNAVREEKIEVFPNGYREERFFPKNKSEARKKFRLPEDAFIVGFVGSFDHRKGIERLIDAIEDLDGIYAICAGAGELMPKSEKCLYSQSVNNRDLPAFYSAADIFVLPTLNEGCCNAIIEAMACGLPIVSSNLQFNDDILDENCSIQVNPSDVDEIKEAIRILYSDEEKRLKLRSGSIEKAKNLTLTSRTKGILNFMNQSKG